MQQNTSLNNPRDAGLTWKNIILPAYEVRKRKEQKTAFIDLSLIHI